MKIYEIGTGYTSIPAQVAAATESVVEELTKALLELGAEVQILDISAAERAPHNLPITEVKVPPFFTRGDVSLGLMHKVKRVIYSIALALKLKKLLAGEAAGAVLHFHNQYNLFFFLKLVPERLRRRASIVYTNHNGLWSLPWDEVCTTLQKRYFQEVAAMKQADVIFVLNSKMQHNVVTHLGIPPERVRVISNGVNTRLYCPLNDADKSEIRSSYGLQNKRVILQVGSVNENKGQGRALSLLAPLLKSNSNLVYAYAGEIVSQQYFDEVQQLAAALGVAEQVRYLGAVSPGAQMNALYNVAQATVFASRYEGFPLVCIESLSAGVPVVLCTDTVDKMGGCIDCNADNIADKLPPVLDDNSALSMAARDSAVANYGWGRIARDYLSELNKNN